MLPFFPFFPLGQYNNTGAFKNLCSAFSLPHCHHHGPQGNDPYPDEGTPGCPDATSPQCPTQCDARALAPHNNFAKDRYSFQGAVTTYPGMILVSFLRSRSVPRV